MAIGFGTADGSGWEDIGLCRRILMPSGIMADGHEAMAAIIVVRRDAGGRMVSGMTNDETLMTK